MNKGKVVANFGVPRNKKPLQNIVYTVDIRQLKTTTNVEEYEQYKWKDEGYLILLSRLERSQGGDTFHGCITPGRLKEFLGPKQWPKFCQGKRVFIMQRRIDGKNTPTGAAQF